MTGNPKRAYEVLAEARSLVETDRALMRDGLYTVIFLQGVTALRRGETDNCVMCRGESSCILPIAPAAHAHDTPPARGWRSATSPNTSSNFPRMRMLAGCSTWPT